MHDVNPLAVLFGLLVVGAAAGLYYKYNTPDNLVVMGVDPAAKTMLVSDNRTVILVEYCSTPPALGIRSFCYDTERDCLVQQTTYCGDGLLGAYAKLGRQ